MGTNLADVMLSSYLPPLDAADVFDTIDTAQYVMNNKLN